MEDKPVRCTLRMGILENIKELGTMFFTFECIRGYLSEDELKSFCDYNDLSLFANQHTGTYIICHPETSAYDPMTHIYPL